MGDTAAGMSRVQTAMISLAVLALINAALAAPIHSGPFVQAPIGQLHGLRYQSPQGGLVDAYLGLPYAEPPIPRFKAPVPKTPWNGTYDATYCRPMCPQRGFLSATGALVGDESCLYLNIYVPANVSTPMPVLVWVHGGGFTSGSGCLASYNGTQLAATQSVIVVTINYRLGVLGSFSNAELAAEGDGSLGGMNAIRDQIQALKFVKQNIRAFGGDPNAVTVAGESAGGESMVLLAASKLAAGLFRKMVISSAAAYGPWGFMNRSYGLEQSDEFMGGLNVSSVAELRAMNVSTLMAPLWFATPRVDGVVMPHEPVVEWASGTLNFDALMIGVNTADGLAEFPYFAFGNLSMTMNASAAAAVLAMTIPDVPASEVLSQYPAKRFGGRYDLVVTQSYRDRALHCTVGTMTKWAAQTSVVYSYLFGSNWRGGWLNSTTAGSWGNVNLPESFLPHGLDLLFVFGHQPDLVPNKTWTASDIGNVEFGEKIFSQQLTTSVQNYWGTFMRDGVPSDGTSRVEWPKVSLESQGAKHMYFGDDVPKWMGSPGALLGSASEADCDFWRKHPFHFV